MIGNAARIGPAARDLPEIDMEKLESYQDGEADGKNEPEARENQLLSRAHAKESAGNLKAKKTTRRLPECWSEKEEESFFLGLQTLQEGKNWTVLVKRVKTKNKEQVRHYYYRMIKRMNKLLQPELKLDPRDELDVKAGMLMWWSLMKEQKCDTQKLLHNPSVRQRFKNALVRQLCTYWQKKTCKAGPSTDESGRFPAEARPGLRRAPEQPIQFSTASAFQPFKGVATATSPPQAEYHEPIQSHAAQPGNAQESFRGVFLDKKGSNASEQTTRVGSQTNRKEGTWMMVPCSGKRVACTDRPASIEQQGLAAAKGGSLRGSDPLRAQQWEGTPAREGTSQRRNAAVRKVAETTRAAAAMLATGPEPNGKLSLQLFPLDDISRQLVEQGGNNPHLELTLKGRKPVASIVQHLMQKWGLGAAEVSGEMRLYPYEASVRARLSWGLDDKGTSAADVNEALGKPLLLRLRYGWCEHGSSPAQQAATSVAAVEGPGQLLTRHVGAAEAQPLQSSSPATLPTISLGGSSNGVLCGFGHRTSLVAEARPLAGENSPLVQAVAGSSPEASAKWRGLAREELTTAGPEVAPEAAVVISSSSMHEQSMQQRPKAAELKEAGSSAAHTVSNPGDKVTVESGKQATEASMPACERQGDNSMADWLDLVAGVSLSGLLAKDASKEGFAASHFLQSSPTSCRLQGLLPVSPLGLHPQSRLQAMFAGGDTSSPSKAAFPALGEPSEGMMSPSPIPREATPARAVPVALLGGEESRDPFAGTGNFMPSFSGSFLDACGLTLSTDGHQWDTSGRHSHGAFAQNRGDSQRGAQGVDTDRAPDGGVSSGREHDKDNGPEAAVPASAHLQLPAQEERPTLDLYWANSLGAGDADFAPHSGISNGVDFGLASPAADLQLSLGDTLMRSLLNNTDSLPPPHSLKPATPDARLPPESIPRTCLSLAGSSLPSSEERNKTYEGNTELTLRSGNAAGAWRLEQNAGPTRGFEEGRPSDGVRLFISRPGSASRADGGEGVVDAAAPLIGSSGSLAEPRPQAPEAAERPFQALFSSLPGQASEGEFCSSAAGAAQTKHKPTSNRKIGRSSRGSVAEGEAKKGGRPLSASAGPKGAKHLHSCLHAEQRVTNSSAERSSTPPVEEGLLEEPAMKRQRRTSGSKKLVAGEVSQMNRAAAAAVAAALGVGATTAPSWAVMQSSQ